MFCSTLLAAGLVLAFGTSTYGQQTISIVADEWAPFGGAELPGGGISLDVISTVLSRAGYQVTTEILPWERALEGVKTGTYDVIGNLFLDPGLQTSLSYSSPFYETEVRFLQHRGAGLTFTDLDSLRPYTIAVGAGYLYEDSFDNADFLKKRTVTTVAQGVRMVANERVDLTLDSVDVLNHIIRKEDPALADLVEYLPSELTVQAIHMGVRKDLPKRDELIVDFNRVLAEMKSDGSLDQLLEKHRS